MPALSPGTAMNASQPGYQTVLQPDRARRLAAAERPAGHRDPAAALTYHGAHGLAKVPAAAPAWRSQQIAKHCLQRLIRRRHGIVGKSLGANPDELLSLLRRHHPLPLAAHIERHQQVKRLVAVTGEGECGQAFRIYRDPKLLLELAD